MTMMKVVDVDTLDHYNVTVLNIPTFWYNVGDTKIYLTVKDAVCRREVTIKKTDGVAEELNILEDAMTTIAGATLVTYKGTIAVYNGSAPVPNAIRRIVREYKE